MHKTYRYRLFTNASQERELGSTLESHRRLYNAALDGRQLCWETAGVGWNYYDQSRWFTAQRKLNPYFANLNASSAQQTLMNLDKAYKAFFDRCKRGEKPGHPRFKSRDRFESFAYAMTGHGGGCKIINGKLRLQNIGTIRVRWHRPVPDDAVIKQATIKRYAGKWYVCFAVELPDVTPVAVPPASVGIDLGITSFVTTSYGESLGDSKILRRHLSELRRRQRALSRCQRGSSRRCKVKSRVTRLHAAVANARRDMHHKVAHQLVTRYGFIAAENLNVLGMLKNRRLSRSIADAGWGQFVSILTHKAEGAGVQVELVDPRNTSQKCSQCGQMVRKSLAVRVHRCLCGCVLDRDVNAARNVLARTGAKSSQCEC